MIKQCSLLPVSPMLKVEKDDDTDVGDHETAKFNAEAHLNFFRAILHATSANYLNGVSFSLRTMRVRI